MKHNKILIFLVIINLLWSASALIYDFDKIIATPFYIWPFVVICPIYPLLLAFGWIGLYFNRPNQFLITVSALNSSIFFIAALIYYPTWMLLNGFDWLAFGQIFWVAFYGLQGLYLITKTKPNIFAVAAAQIFLILLFAIQYETNSFGFFDTTNFSQVLILILYGVLALISFLLSGLLFVKNRY